MRTIVKDLLYRARHHYDRAILDLDDEEHFQKCIRSWGSEELAGAYLALTKGQDGYKELIDEGWSAAKLNVRREALGLYLAQRVLRAYVKTHPLRES